MDVVALIVGFAFLFAASWHDVRTREVPDLLSYGLLVFALAYAVAKALLLSSWNPLLHSLAGFGLFFLLGLVMFYTGQWGGADSKLLMGLGALLGLSFQSWDAIIYLVFALFAGAIYGIFYTAVLAFTHGKLFKKALVTFLRQPRVLIARVIVIIACFLLLGFAFLLPEYRIPLIVLLLAVYFLFYVWIVVKVVEQSLLIKAYPVSKLTEGDWIHEEVVKGKRTICGPKDYGISNAQIATLKRLKVKRVMVKEGIPFVPSFLLGLILYALFHAKISALLALI